MPSKLSQNQIDSALKDLPGWSAHEGKLHREFKFKDFSAAFAFMTRVAMVAEKMDHHPDWSNNWNKVSVDLVTHSAGGITENDTELARKMSELCAPSAT